MRKLRDIALLTVLWTLALGSVSWARSTLYTIDPNGANAPAEVKNLKLSFRTDTQSIVAPSILCTDDGSLAFVNYPVSASVITSNADGTTTTSGTQGFAPGYVLVVRPQETDVTRQIVKAIQVGLRPRDMYFNPSRTEIWCVNLGHYGVNDNHDASISIIDVASQAVKATIALPNAVLSLGSNLVFSQDGNTAYIASTGTDEILKLDAVEHKILASTKIPYVSQYYYEPYVGPAALTLSHNGAFLCCVNTFDCTVSVVDLGQFKETGRVTIRNADQIKGTTYWPVFTFYNNVALSPDDTTGVVAEAGDPRWGKPLGEIDRVYFFDVATAKKLQTENAKKEKVDVVLLVDDSPSHVTFDPTGHYLIVEGASYDGSSENASWNTTASIFTWPGRELYKKMEFKNPEFAMAPTGRMKFLLNGDGTYDLLFPSFSPKVLAKDQEDTESIVRVPFAFGDPCRSMAPYGDSKTVEFPVTMEPIPGTLDRFLVANYRTGTLTAVTPPPSYVYSTLPGVTIDDTRYCAVVLYNPYPEAVKYYVQGIQIVKSGMTDSGNSEAGTPFYWVDDQKTAHILPPEELTLQPNQLLIRPIKQFLPNYDKIKNQFGFLKFVNESRPVNGCLLFGKVAADGKLLSGDYIKAISQGLTESLYPFVDTMGTRLRTFLHYSNPDLNLGNHSYAFYFNDPEAATSTSAGYKIASENGYANVLGGDLAIGGFARLFNLDNCRSQTCMTIEAESTDSTKPSMGSFAAACPALDPAFPSKTHKFVVPYWAVGAGYDTTLALVNLNPRYDSTIVDSAGKPIPQKTKIRIDYNFIGGEAGSFKEVEVLNESRIEISLSDRDYLNHSIYSPELWIGSLTITCEKDFFSGAYMYTETLPVTGNDTIDKTPYMLTKNMTVSPYFSDLDAVEVATIPYVVKSNPYSSGLIIHNPGEAAQTASLEVYDTNGVLYTRSTVDLNIAPHASSVFLLGDPTVFPPVPSLDGFQGYLKVRCTSGGKLISSCVQSTPDLMATVPTM